MITTGVYFTMSFYFIKYISMSEYFIYGLQSLAYEMCYKYITSNS